MTDIGSQNGSNPAGASGNGRLRRVSLEDRFDLAKRTVLLNGSQALVRAMLSQSARDGQAGLRTAGYVSGYRGSPLGGLDFQMSRADAQLTAANIRFEPALNEDLAVTALWGAQQVDLRGEGQVQGVFGLWYGKGPGVDRSGDAFRHANMAGAAQYGGVVAALGDDHTGESSTTLHHSELAMIDYAMPILAPAGVQEVFDHTIAGIALSRFSGNWVGLKCIKETIEATAVIDGDPHRARFCMPTMELPAGGLNIRLQDTPVDREIMTLDWRGPAARAFARCNRFDRSMWCPAGARIGLAAAGKSWLDLQHALYLLGLRESDASRFGLTTYKVSMPWPLDCESFTAWCAGLDLVILVEEKRKVIEPQAKTALFNMANRPRIYGERDHEGRELFPSRLALDPLMVATGIARTLAQHDHFPDYFGPAAMRLEADRKASSEPELITRKPYFCSGCPHNRSTEIPDGSRAYAGIGCHYMVQWMDRSTEGFTHMGGEGANWIGEARFSQRAHIFQNMGDGTYNHSGLQAIRAACAAEVNITFKILFNDAVAMTGGQLNDGGLGADRLAHELAAFGVKRLVIVHDEKEPLDRDRYPPMARIYPRSDFDRVQRELRDTPGVTALVYVQTCAAEKRRRRKRGRFPDPQRRIFINSDVCEGCGDCGVQSNCLSITPVETPLGRKRMIDQSSCNKDYSCLLGFCPALVAVDGGTLKPPPTVSQSISEIPMPTRTGESARCALVISGVGGTGVVTIGAILSMAAHLDRRGVGMIEMAGLAQKGGAVQIHCRIAPCPEDISAIRVSAGEADCVIAGDLAVAASAESLAMLAQDRSFAVVNSAEIMTGDFVQNAEFQMPNAGLTDRLRGRLATESLLTFNASALALTRLGDSLYANMILLGAAWQSGAVPLSLDALQTAIELNGTAVEANRRAFELGRLAALGRVQPDPMAQQEDEQDGQIDPIACRRDHLLAYGGERYQRRFDAFVGRFADDRELQLHVADSYHRLLAVKDEFEVARLHLKTEEQVREHFQGPIRLTFFLAPPIPGQSAKSKRPRKRAFGRVALWGFWLLSRMRFLRDGKFNPFAHSEERRLSRALIGEYEQDIARCLHNGGGDGRDALLELAALPSQIKGFGPVWMAGYEASRIRRQHLLERLGVTAQDS